MSKYVNVDAFVEALCKTLSTLRKQKDNTPESIAFLKGAQVVAKELMKFPAADVAPVVHGELTEHIHELLRAEKDGRLVVLPCKIGATVYRFQRYFNDATLKSEIKIKPCEVESVSIESLMTTDHVFLLFSDFGKTVFFTRKEAEKALEGNNGQKR